MSLTADPDQAGGWANRAPEVTWEALCSVYRLRHPDLGDDWNQSDEGHFWVLAQQMPDPPVIIAATAPLTALRAWPREDTAADLLVQLIDTGQSDYFRSCACGVRSDEPSRATSNSQASKKYRRDSTRALLGSCPARTLRRLPNKWTRGTGEDLADTIASACRGSRSPRSGVALHQCVTELEAVAGHPLG